jgi:hypothetical protein
MAILNTRPATVDVTGYAGDTLIISVTAPTAFIAGRAWTAQVRASTAAATVDAEFVVTPPTQTDGPALVTLPAVDTARLAAAASYTGVWDVQLAPAGGGDPVTTLAAGRLIISADVTRPS